MTCSTPHSPARFSLRVSVVFTIAIALLLLACDSQTQNRETSPEITSLDISPDSVTLAVGATQSFTVVGKTEDGETVSNVQVRWWSSDSSVFRVNSDGLATAQDSGRAFCMVELLEEPMRKRRFVGLDSASVFVVMK